MAPFSEGDRDRLDWQLLQNGAVTLYFQSAILEGDLAWLRDHGYRIETIDCHDLTAFYRQVSLALNFKEQFGYDGWTGNLDALNDALRHPEVDPQSGLIFCFLRYDLIRTASPELADGVLDMIERNSRDYLLYGRRLLALVQSDDPRIQFHSLGARSANWSRREWFNKDRV
jgi:RNAse (barnase) inhibitor barstar